MQERLPHLDEQCLETFLRDIRANLVDCLSVCFKIISRFNKHECFIIFVQKKKKMFKEDRNSYCNNVLIFSSIILGIFFLIKCQTISFWSMQYNDSLESRCNINYM